MESPLALWQRRRDEPWITGFAPGELSIAVEKAREHRDDSRISIVATDPRRWVIEFLAGVTAAAPCEIYLGPVPATHGGADLVATTSSRIMIATGGTTGVPRYAVHTWDSLHAAALGLQEALGGGPVHSFCVLPLHHVSGLMQVVRSWISGGTLVLGNWASLEAGEFETVRAESVISLVPTQLVRLLALDGGAEWLRQFRAVFLGGAAAWPSLLAKASEAGVPLAPCYGMTETAAQITMLSPQAFLAGKAGVGRALPHAEVEIVDETGGVLGTGREGRIRIRARSLFQGYHPQIERRGELLTNDVGWLDVDGSLTVLGRADDVINTGGEKVHPTEIEAAIRATGLVTDVAVFGERDEEWGEVVVAVVCGIENAIVERLNEVLRASLPAHKRPKRWRILPSVPRSAAGKIDRAKLRGLER